MFLQFFLLLIGFTLLVKGANFLVEGGSNIAKKFYIPELVIGLTVVSIGTSMPELMISVISALNGYTDMCIGNVIGSNLSNLLLVLGFCSIIRNLNFKNETKYFESPFALIITVLLYIISNNKLNGKLSTITRTEGIILLLVCGCFIIYNIIMSKKGQKFNDNSENQINTKINNNNISNKKFVIKSIFFIIIGVIFLKFGGDFVVNSASKIAMFCGMNQKVISLTVISIATSLPELVTSAIATKKGEIDIAIGNIIGSCIFNILLIIGISACIVPIKYSINYNNDLIILIIATLILNIFPFTGKRNKMTKVNGIIYLLGYIIYITNLVI